MNIRNLSHSFGSWTSQQGDPLPHELSVFIWWAVLLGRLLIYPCPAEYHSICLHYKVACSIEESYSCFHGNHVSSGLSHSVKFMLLVLL